MLKYRLAQFVCWLLDLHTGLQHNRLWNWSLRTILHHELPPEKRVMYLHGNRSVLLREQGSEKGKDGQ